MVMRKISFFVLMCLIVIICKAQEYTVKSAGQGNSGNYLVDVIVSSKKKVTSTAEDLVREYAVRGVMFRGLMSSSGYGEQKPLIQDPNTEQIHSEWFNAFFSEGRYKNYSAIDGGLTVMKNKQTKMYEVSARVNVDKESLVKYLETESQIFGFSNLW